MMFSVPDRAKTTQVPGRDFCLVSKCVRLYGHCGLHARRLEGKGAFCAPPSTLAPYPLKKPIHYRFGPQSPNS